MPRELDSAPIVNSVRRWRSNLNQQARSLTSTVGIRRIYYPHKHKKHVTYKDRGSFSVIQRFQYSPQWKRSVKRRTR